MRMEKCEIGKRVSPPKQSCVVERDLLPARSIRWDNNHLRNKEYVLLLLLVGRERERVALTERRLSKGQRKERKDVGVVVEGWAALACVCVCKSEFDLATVLMNLWWKAQFLLLLLLLLVAHLRVEIGMTLTLRFEGMQQPGEWWTELDIMTDTTCVLCGLAIYIGPPRQDYYITFLYCKINLKLFNQNPEDNQVPRYPRLFMFIK